MIASYHNHSSWSDGKASIPDLCAGGLALGLHELGISDHFVLPPAGAAPRWSLDPAQLGDYVDEVRAQVHPGLTVRLGLEVDWFPDHDAALHDALAPYSFDYLIGSVHHVGALVIDASSAAWDTLDAREQDDVHRAYWTRIRAMAESGLFDVAAHLDLSKKFGHRPTNPPVPEIDAALDAIAAAGMVVELNTAGWYKPCADAYPSAEILVACRERDIPVTISADAHQPAHLLRDFDRGLRRLADAGYRRVARFHDRRITFEPLESAMPKSIA